MGFIDENFIYEKQPFITKGRNLQRKKGGIPQNPATITDEQERLIAVGRWEYLQEEYETKQFVEALSKLFKSPSEEEKRRREEEIKNLPFFPASNLE